MSPILDNKGYVRQPTAPDVKGQGRFRADELTGQALLKETEKLLDTWKHPDPYLPPTAPGGMYASATILCNNKDARCERRRPSTCD